HGRGHCDPQQVAPPDQPLPHAPPNPLRERVTAPLGALSGVRLAVPTRVRCHESMWSMPVKVLIVDDHPSFRATARLLLESEGFEVVGEAADGMSGLRDARELEPDLVLLDVQ